MRNLTATVVDCNQVISGVVTLPQGDIGADVKALNVKIGDLSQLATTAKSNLVAAINEAATSGGSGGAIDGSLRSDLANPDKGAAMVARGVVAVDSIADLLTLPEEYRRDDLRYSVKGYHAGSDIGGGEFYWVALATGEPDGGVVLKPAESASAGRFIREKILPVTPHSFGVVDNQESGENLQKFFDFVSSDVSRYTYDMTCDTISARRLVLHSDQKAGVENGKVVHGYMKLFAEGNLIDVDDPYFVRLSALRDWEFTGGFYLNGYTSYTGRKRILHGIGLTNHCRKLRISRVEGRGGQGYLIAMTRESNNNMSEITKLSASNFGVKPDLNPDREYTFVSSSGAPTSGAHRSVISVDLSDVPSILRPQMLLRISGQPQVVMEYNESLKQATLYPGFLSNHVHTGLCGLLYGGALLATGKDAGEFSYNSLTATNCGIAHHDRAMYGTVGSRLTTQNCGAAYVTGIAVGTMGGFGTVISQPYCEANSFDLVSISSAGAGHFIAPIALDIDKCFCISPPAIHVSPLARFIIEGFLSQTPGDGRWLPTPSATCQEFSGTVARLSTPATVYLDGLGTNRTDRRIELSSTNRQVVVEGLNSREAVIYRQVRSIRIVGGAGETVNGLPELVTPDTPVIDGTVLRAYKHDSNWIVTFYVPSDISPTTEDKPTSATLDFVNNAYTLDGSTSSLNEISEFIRLSSAMEWQDGNLVEVQDNIPRISSAGLLLEGSSTELITDNSTITSANTAWAATSKPDTQVGNVFEFVSAGTTAQISTNIPEYPAGNVSPNSGYYYRSILAKKSTADSFLRLGSFSPAISVVVNLKNGSLEYSGSAIVESKITEINEYYRIETLATEVSASQRQFLLDASNNRGAGATLAAPTIGHKVTLALPSFRDTADFPQSFVRTSGIQVTRAPDTLNIPLLPTQTITGNWDTGVTHSSADGIATFTGHGRIRTITVGES